MTFSRSANLLLLLGICAAALIFPNSAGAQTRAAPESGLITWPVFSSGPIREVPRENSDAPTLLTELSTINVYSYDPGGSLYYRLVIADYEVSNVRASYGWTPAGALGVGDGRMDVNLTGRVLWGGVLDSVIQIHHDVTGLPNGGRDQRPWGESLLIIAPAVRVPLGEHISEYPDDEFVEQAIVSTPGPHTSFAVGGHYSRSVLAPWLRVFASTGVSTLPRVSSTIGAGGAVTGNLTTGVHLQWRPLDWLRLSTQGDVSGMAVAGAGAWRSVLTNTFLMHGAGRVELILNKITVATVFSVRRSPMTVPYYRLQDPSISLDTSAYFPVPGLPNSRLVVGFVQDFPPSFVAPDFGISLGMVTPTGGR